MGVHHRHECCESSLQGRGKGSERTISSQNHFRPNDQKKEAHSRRRVFQVQEQMVLTRTQDPDTGTFEVFSPTPCTEAITLVLPDLLERVLLDLVPRRQEGFVSVQDHEGRYM